MNAILEHVSTKELDALSRELASIIEAIEQLETVERPYLLALYQKYLGDLEYRLLQLQVEGRALQCRIERLQARLNRGETLTRGFLAGVEAEVATELRGWRVRLLEQAQSLEAGRRYLASLVPVAAETLARTKAAYRRLARLLHPDASPENADLFDRYWATVQDAYRCADADLLEALLHLVERSLPPPPEAEDPAVEDAKTHRLRKLIAAQAERLGRLRTQSPFCWARELRDAAWIAAKRTELEAAIAAESERVALLVTRYAEIASLVREA